MNIATSDEPVIQHIFVVGFHHQRGAEVEFSYPDISTADDGQPFLPPAWHNLSALALPDGAHLAKSDAVYFLLPDNRDGDRQLCAVACFRQIDKQDLKEVGKDVTRQVVQKSVCVLSRQPLFGLVHQQLEFATHAYFREKNFTKTQILVEVYNHLNYTLRHSIHSKPSTAISSRQLVLAFGRKCLVLFKLLLLEKKVVFFCHPVKRLCDMLLATVSLFPGALEQLLTNVVPEPVHLSSPESSNTALTDEISQRTDEYGLPLMICRQDVPIHPYISLQQIELLKNERVRGCLVGATNALFQRQPNLCSVFVDVAAGSVEIRDEELRQQLTLTVADQRFAEQLVSTVRESEVDVLSGSPTSWLGGDDWIRQQFRQYVLSLLVCSLDKDSRTLADYGTLFTNAWKKTSNYQLWTAISHPRITDVEARHPCKGQLGLSDLRKNVTADQLRDTMATTRHRLGEAMSPLRAQIGVTATNTKQHLEAAMSNTRQEIGSAWANASSAVGSWWSSWRSSPSRIKRLSSATSVSTSNTPTKDTASMSSNISTNIAKGEETPSSSTGEDWEFVSNIEDGQQLSSSSSPEGEPQRRNASSPKGGLQRRNASSPKGGLQRRNASSPEGKLENGNADSNEYGRQHSNASNGEDRQRHENASNAMGRQQRDSGEEQATVIVGDDSSNSARQDERANIGSDISSEAVEDKALIQVENSSKVNPDL